MISHAYLLTGPRGVGKTSIARILAYEANSLPYDEEGTHLDIIEIDAASNRRIDEIRELKERVNIAPTSAKYKVYIIDEVHMLTKEAFNALLKTLEEPPEHAIFILATTEAHKVPETIISRTQRFTFKPVDFPKVVAHLKEIAKTEKISIDDDALELIAAHGEGSFRDSISLLDQIRHTNEHINVEDVQQAIGQAPEQLLQELLSGISSHDVQSVGAGLASLRAQGVQAAQIAHQLSKLVRYGLLARDSTFAPQQALKLLAELVQVPAMNDPAIGLELALYKSALEGASVDSEPRSQEVTTEISKTKAPKEDDKIESKKPKKSIPEPKSPTDDSVTKTLDAKSWQEVLAAIKTKHNTLYGITRMAVPSFEANKLTLAFAFAFHQKKLNDEKNRRLLQDTIAHLTGAEVAIDCVLDTTAQSVPPITKPEVKNAGAVNLETISNIFGGAEVVE